MSLANKRVLYISYNGMLDPLGQSQVIPYLKALSERGYQFTLLSFESRLSGAEAEAERLKIDLTEYGIEWHALPYHKTPSLPATAFDVSMGIRYAKRLVRKNKIAMVHARSHVPAIIARRLKMNFGLKMIFDVRGLLADEYVDAQHWRKNSLAYRLTKIAERRALAAADGVVTLTERIWPILSQWDGLRNNNPVHAVVPCCADLELFRFNQQHRESKRRELKLNQRRVIVYSGSIDGWYLTEEMANLFAVVREQEPDACFLWLTPARHDRIHEIMKVRDIGSDDYRVIAAPPHDVAAYLCAADVGLAFIKPCLSKLASSPTKYAEYLGCELPIIINSDIGDSDRLVSHHKLGALVRDFNKSEFQKAWDTIRELINAPTLVRQSARRTAEELFDVRRAGVERYADLYEKVLAK